MDPPMNPKKRRDSSELPCSSFPRRRESRYENVATRLIQNWTTAFAMVTKPKFETAMKVSGEITMDQPVVEVTNLSRSFGGKPALDGVSFCAIPGQVHGLVGSNGAGKTTLL